MREHDHTIDGIRRRLESGPRSNYIRDWVYGGIDGAVTTFAIVAGVVGADLSTRVILILGAANILADGFSMAASNYSGTKTERDDYDRLREYERRQVHHLPDGEREEIRQIFHSKGFRDDDLDRATDIITSDIERWVDTMMTEEWGLTSVMRSPSISGLTTFASFLLCGLIPLLPFVLGVPAAFEIAVILTAAVFFAIGTVKSRWALSPWWRSGGETLLIGLIAAAIAYLIGFGLKTVI